MSVKCQILHCCSPELSLLVFLHFPWPVPLPFFQEDEETMCSVEIMQVKWSRTEEGRGGDWLSWLLFRLYSGQEKKKAVDSSVGMQHLALRPKPAAAAFFTLSCPTLSEHGAMVLVTCPPTVIPLAVESGCQLYEYCAVGMWIWLRYLLTEKDVLSSLHFLCI